MTGNFGDSICFYCLALLLNSEVNKSHKSQYKNITSSFCCGCGSFTLPDYTEFPQLFQELLQGDSVIYKEFLSNQNTYNSLLAFASISVGYQDSSLGGEVCFMLNGEFMRSLSSMFSGCLTHHSPNYIF